MPCDFEENRCVVEEAGVRLEIVCGYVPVITLDATTVFDDCVSWLLQTATGSSGKANSLFDYFVDDLVMEEVARLGHDPQFMMLARMHRSDLSDVRAVAMTKRSIMLALVVAMVIQRKCSIHQIAKEVRAYDAKVEAPLTNLLSLALKSVTKAKANRR